jgi:hypothetical protein
MPTYIRIARKESPAALLFKELRTVSIFVLLGLLQLLIAVQAGGQWAAFSELALW